MATANVPVDEDEAGEPRWRLVVPSPLQMASPGPHFAYHAGRPAAGVTSGRTAGRLAAVVLLVAALLITLSGTVRAGPPIFIKIP
ncbi:MAG TPA: hypothetical protein VMF65_03160 [Acidimicrobiales bacterium]|nr:hypothetical protein [Acidimicrobiales bacterium]